MTRSKSFMTSLQYVINFSVERNDNFLAKARKLSILSTSLDIFDIRQHYIRILYLSAFEDNAGQRLESSSAQIL